MAGVQVPGGTAETDSPPPSTCHLPPPTCHLPPATCNLHLSSEYREGYPYTYLIDFLLDEPADARWRNSPARISASRRSCERCRPAGALLAPTGGRVVDQARLHERAKRKFPQADHLLFVNDALQQASSSFVATYHAQQFVEFFDRSPTPRSPLPAPRSLAPRYRIADLGCGMGRQRLPWPRRACTSWRLNITPHTPALLKSISRRWTWLRRAQGAVRRLDRAAP